jgi:hypothetical protein
MILPRRQQAILNQLDRELGTSDPQLRSSYADFTRQAGGAPFPAAEAIAQRPYRFLVLGLIFLLAVGFLAFGINDLKGGCPASAWHGVCTTTVTTPGGSDGNAPG